MVILRKTIFILLVCCLLVPGNALAQEEPDSSSSTVNIYNPINNLCGGLFFWPAHPVDWLVINTPGRVTKTLYAYHYNDRTLYSMTINNNCFRPAMCNGESLCDVQVVIDDSWSAACYKSIVKLGYDGTVQPMRLFLTEEEPCRPDIVDPR
jgi:hypothetical protein